MQIFSIPAAGKRHNADKDRNRQMLRRLRNADDELGIIYRLRHNIIGTQLDFPLQTLYSLVQMLHIRIKRCAYNKIRLLLERLA
ncbi:hypothetical protein D3C78_1055610 [compost metagenome]